MIRGLYISGTNLRVNQGKIDAISNNLANIEIVGLPYRMTILGLISSNISLTSRNRLL